MPRRAPTLAANGGPGELLNQHHPQQPLLPLYHITLFLSCHCYGKVARSVPHFLSLWFRLTMTLPLLPSCETGNASSASSKLSPPPDSLYYLRATARWSPLAGYVGRPMHPLYLASFSTTRDSDFLPTASGRRVQLRGETPVPHSSPLRRSA